MDLSSLFEKQFYQSGRYTQGKHFIVVGAGGTGGYLIPNLARQISLQNKIRREEGLPSHTFTIIDGDIVEPKNLIRQQFVTADIGKNKAEVMANRYGNHFEVGITYVPTFMENMDTLENLMRSDENMPVVIDCVDNNKTRMLMYDACVAYSRGGDSTNASRQVFFLSSGNEEHTGQVIFSSLAGHRLRTVLNHIEGLTGKFSDSVQTPTIVDLFPTTANGEDKLPTEESCAEQSISAPQNIHTNMTAANLLFGFLNQILQKDGELDHFAIFYNTKTMSFRTFYNKQSDFQAALAMTKDNPSTNYYMKEGRSSSNRPDYKAMFKSESEEATEAKESSEGLPF